MTKKIKQHTNKDVPENDEYSEQNLLIDIYNILNDILVEIKK